MNLRKRRQKERFLSIVLAVFIGFAAFMFIVPTILTISNSFMTSNEITANYGAMLNNMNGTEKTFISDKLNLKFIPDKVTFSQYVSVLFKSPEYLLKFWNSVILVVPITVFQLLVALFASYGFARSSGKLKNIIFFSYIILMLMPYQVTLVPNFLVADKFGLLNTRWSIILPGIFSPFSVFLLTKIMRRIPSSYIEAAKLDGASEWQILFHICIPLCKSALFSVALLVFIDYWNMVEQPLIMLKDKEMHPLSVFLSE
ncbi:MAG TPA: carbohydrate ABC transporter permease, partial [Ruminococcus sp.]|nr:carbohydrate ABC transporter permease [Ruminococcus sp.]